jgi:hypothetical protein
LHVVDDGAHPLRPTTMSHPEQPIPQPAPQLDSLTREQRLRELHDELLKLNAQLECLRLLMKLRLRGT